MSRATPIRAITAELRQGRPPHDVATAREEHTLVPTEIRELIAAFDTGRRPPGRQRRRATDRGGVADGTQAAPPVRRPPARLHDPALTDAVTGLANRSGLAEHLANVDGESPLDGTTAVHCIALTDLESVTDALGRVAAEALLRSIALRIARSVRDSDLVARVGHAELAIVQHDVRSRENALSLAQRIRALLAEPIAIGDWEIAAAVSIGIALAPQGSETYTSWLIEAETAMTQARSCRAGTIMIFEEKMRGDPEIVPRRTVALA